MKSDVKAVRKNSTGSVFVGRTRLRGIILASSGSAGSKNLFFKKRFQSQACRRLESSSSS